MFKKKLPAVTEKPIPYSIKIQGFTLDAFIVSEANGPEQLAIKIKGTSGQKNNVAEVRLWMPDNAKGVMEGVSQQLSKDCPQEGFGSVDEVATSVQQGIKNQHLDSHLQDAGAVLKR